MTGSMSAKPAPSGKMNTTTDEATVANRTASARWHAAAQPPHAQSANAGQRRIEPSLGNETFPPPGASAAYGKLHGTTNDSDDYPPAQRLPVRRLMMMALVFIVGAAVGLTTAWWLHRPVARAPVVAVQPASTSATSTPNSNQSRATAVRGISPSELPYDGAPPPENEAHAPPPTLSSGSQSGTSLSTGAGATDAANDFTGGARDDTQHKAERKSEELVPEPIANAPATPQKAVRESKETTSRDTVKAARSSKQESPAVAASAPKRKNVSKSATDREIERIRRQADEELKKKTDRARVAGDRRGAPGNTVDRVSSTKVASSSRESSTRAVLAKCDKASSFIHRELCKWRVCNGSWGKNGCPSYRQPPPSY